MLLVEELASAGVITDVTNVGLAVDDSPWSVSLGKAVLSTVTVVSTLTGVLVSSWSDWWRVEVSRRMGDVLE